MILLELALIDSLFFLTKLKKTVTWVFKGTGVVEKFIFSKLVRTDPNHRKIMPDDVFEWFSTRLPTGKHHFEPIENSARKLVFDSTRAIEISIFSKMLRTDSNHHA